MIKGEGYSTAGLVKTSSHRSTRQQAQAVTAPKDYNRMSPDKAVPGEKGAEFSVFPSSFLLPFLTVKQSLSLVDDTGQHVVCCWWNDAVGLRGYALVSLCLGYTPTCFTHLPPFPVCRMGRQDR